MYIKRLESGLGEWVITYRWWIILASVLIVTVAGSGVQFLTFNRDMRVFFSPENPQLQALETLEQTYATSDNVLFGLAPEGGDVFSQEFLAAVEELTERAWQMPYSTRVDSLTNYQHVRVEGDDLFVGNLVEHAEDLSDTELERIRRIALAEPTLLNRLVSPAGHVTAVWVSIVLPGSTTEEVGEVAAFAQALADDLRQQHPAITLHLAGTVMHGNAYAELTQGDLRTLVPFMFAFVVVVTALSLRSITGTATTLLVIVLSMVTGMGLAGWLGFSLNPASALAPTIIMTLAVADSIHILVTMLHQMRLAQPKRDAITESLRLNLQPVFLTSFTTVIGFLSLNFSDLPPFRDYGTMVAMGVTAAFAYAIFLLPALMTVLPLRVRPISAREDADGHRFARLAELVIARRSLVFWGTLGVGLTLACGLVHLELDDDWTTYFDKRYAIRQAVDFFGSNLMGTGVIEYSLDSGVTGGINDPSYLAVVDSFAAWLRRHPEVVHVSTITDTIKRLNRTFQGGDEAAYQIPQRRDLVAQYLLVYEFALPSGLDLNNQLTVDRSASRATIFLKDTTFKEVRDFEARARNWLRGHAPPSMVTHGSGISVVWAHLSWRAVQSMLGASFGALLLISAILIFALRSLRIGVLSLIPNLAPAVLAFGVWGFLFGQVGLGLSVVVSLTLGIVVDDTIHFLSKYLRARREQNLSPSDAVRYAFHTVGMPLWVTSAALVAGFLVLTFSGYKVSSDMGLMAAITISLALALDFLLLPTLLLMAERGSEPKSVVDLGSWPPGAHAGGRPQR